MTDYNIWMVEAKHRGSIAKGNLTRQLEKNIIFRAKCYLKQTRNLT